MQQIRRASLDSYGFPPYLSNGSYFPHDLDDIYEYKNDHQYFTHDYDLSKPSISSDSQRYHYFHRQNHIENCEIRSFDDRTHHRFENFLFIRNLNNSDASISQSPTKEKSKSTLHEMIKSIGKKAQIWTRRRHESTMNFASDLHSSSCDPQDNFRTRSKSLDVNYTTNRILNDCDATYKIFDKIVREGN